ncbi:hypothetical protein AXX12_07030 [Anaerosporomusa subterranea]|uniref:DUF2997 domain-containing protein n=1 Tax=Anaerosporomusa subterranea TaxID=1794912 RepID=A0A154BQP8_ANASB|nr:DUF2997 domain-containing protein [Anaerosporomusa subterranea]KYZ76190.1 hypothetical protein AXX12_07030 [Anaerosporomusa subterranea]
MQKQFRLQIFPDGRVQVELEGIKGKKCTDYIALLEELTGSETYESAYTADYYEQEDITLQNDLHSKITESEKAGWRR